MRKHLILFFSILVVISARAQNKKIDSLLERLSAINADTTSIIDLYHLSDEYTAIASFTEGLEAAKKAVSVSYEIEKSVKDAKIIKTTKSFRGKSLASCALINTNLGNYSEALNYYNQSLNVRKEIDDKKGIASVYNNIGTIFEHQGNYPEALKYYFSSLKIKENIGEKKSMANTYNNIGNVYNFQKNYPLSIKNHLEALKLRQETGFQAGIAASFNNIGNVYFAQASEEKDDQLRKALLELSLNNNHSSLKISEALEDQKGLANSHLNIGAIWYNKAEHEKDEERKQQMYSEAIKHFEISLRKHESIEDKAGIAASCLNIGSTYLKQMKFENAEKELTRTRLLASELGVKEILKEVYSAFAFIDSAKGDYKQAFENSKLFILYRDSLDNAETRRKTLQSQMTYDFEKKEAVENAEHKKELENQKLLSEERNRKQKVILFFISCFLIAALIFAVFILRSLRLAKKQKIMIDQQKRIVEDKQKEIIDSIQYARRIQYSLLPSESYINKTIIRLKAKADI